jgi:hypothetical protein
MKRFLFYIFFIIIFSKDFCFATEVKKDDKKQEIIIVTPITIQDDNKNDKNNTTQDNKDKFSISQDKNNNTEISSKKEYDKITETLANRAKALEEKEKLASEKEAALKIKEESLVQKEKLLKVKQESPVTSESIKQPTSKCSCEDICACCLGSHKIDRVNKSTANKATAVKKKPQTKIIKKPSTKINKNKPKECPECNQDNKQDKQANSDTVIYIIENQYYDQYYPTSQTEYKIEKSQKQKQQNSSKQNITASNSKTEDIIYDESINLFARNLKDEVAFTDDVSYESVS